MADSIKCVWQGSVPNRYIYWVHKLPANIDEGQTGNYIFTKIVNKTWVPIYIGEGDLGRDTSDLNPRFDCIRYKIATHVHVHVNEAAANRHAEHQDLLRCYPMALEPEGCNKPDD